MPKDRDEQQGHHATPFMDHASSVVRGILHPTFTHFCTIEDAIPLHQRLSWPDWVKVLAPEQPPVREDLSREVRLREALLAEAVDAVLTRPDPGSNQAEHP